MVEIDLRQRSLQRDEWALNSLPACCHDLRARGAYRVAANFGPRRGGATGAPFGSSNIPFGSPSRKASASAVFTTSAYLAFISHRLIAWLACERSKQPSSAIATR